MDLDPKITVYGSNPVKNELAARVASAVDEFYNQCHDKGGKFCPTPGKGSSGGVSGKIAGIPKGAIKSKAIALPNRRQQSRNFARVTNRLGLPKMETLAASNLKGFSNKDLHALKTGLRVYQGRLAIMHVVSVARLSPLGLAHAALALRETGIQVNRINKALKGKSGQLSLIEDVVEELDVWLVEFAAGKPLTIAEEISVAKKQVAEGNLPKVRKPSEKNVEDLLTWLEDGDELGLTAEVAKRIKAELQK